MPISGFADHGFCARGAKPIRNSIGMFFGQGAKASIPISSPRPASRLLCGRSAGEYRAYLPRGACWIRDANDSYFAR